MFLDDFVLEPSENFKSVFLEMVFADFIDSNGCSSVIFFVWFQQLLYYFEGLLMENVTDVITHFWRFANCDSFYQHRSKIRTNYNVWSFKCWRDIKTFWGSIYKPPLTKKVGDLQWWVLLGIIAVNAFISILNPTVQDKCPFCIDRETIFHCLTALWETEISFCFIGNYFLVDKVFTMTDYFWF